VTARRLPTLASLRGLDVLAAQRKARRACRAIGGMVTSWSARIKHQVRAERRFALLHWDHRKTTVPWSRPGRKARRTVNDCAAHLCPGQQGSRHRGLEYGDGSRCSVVLRGWL